MSVVEAKRIIKKLEGTIIADLRSLMEYAKTYLETHRANSHLGALNFTLGLISLVACETLGFYLTGASAHYNNSANHNVDTGTYIMQFIQKYFHSRSYFKRLDKVLADFLRNALVHGFGSYTPSMSFDIDLFIDSDAKNQLQPVQDGSQKVLKLNAFALADHTIAAFTTFKNEANSGKNTGLLSNILRARNLNLPLGNGVTRQFDAVYDLAKRKGL